MGFLKNKAVILQYQNISHDKNNFLDTWICYKCFEEQLEFFTDNDIPIIPLKDTVEYIKGNLSLKNQSFSLTFDTGFIELYTLCFPLLKKYGFPATFFIRSDTVGKLDSIRDRKVQYMNWDQIREIEKAGMTIGMYGCKGEWLSNTPFNVIKDEITEARAIFKRELKNKIMFYAVKDDPPTKPMADLFKEEGFDAAFCMTPTKQKVHRYAVGRIQVDDNDLNIFLIKVSRMYIIFKDTRYWKYIRKYKLDKVVHFFSDTINRLKGKEM